MSMFSQGLQQLGNNIGLGGQQPGNNSPLSQALSQALSMTGIKNGSLTNSLGGMGGSLYNGSGLPWAPGNTNSPWDYVQQAVLPETGSPNGGNGLHNSLAAWNDIWSGNANNGQRFANDIGAMGFGDLDTQGAQRTNDIASANTAKANATATANATANAIKAGQQAMYPGDLQESMLANMHKGRTLYGGNQWQ